MTDKNNYLSRVTYQGGKDSYEFPFSYLRKDFVKAQINLSERESNILAYIVDYTIDGHTLKLTKPVDADKTITIYRETSSEPLVEYEDSSILRAYDLNLSQRQNLNIIEEQTDIVGKSYAFTLDTKDYMYKNLVDTKTAIDNKMSETLETVNASVSTMNETVNTTKKSVEDSLAEMNTTVANVKKSVEDSLETTKSDIEKAMADTQDSMKATENHVDEVEANITKIANEFKESESSLQDAIKQISTTNRNMAYKVGDQIHSSYLPFNCYITCVTAGTTGDTVPILPAGDHDSGFTFTDGTATFKMDYWPLSINGKKPLNKAGDISIDTVNDITDAVISYGVSGTVGKATAMASGVIDQLSSLTGSNDLTSMSKLRSFVGSVCSLLDWYDVISVRHRNGAEDGQYFGLLMYSGLNNSGSIKYKKQMYDNDWTEERTLLDSSNYNSYAPTKTGAGASGTWPISISGNADTVDGYHASDIINSITAANTGGIVAASLTENGYVKFANGLILQWGNAAVPVTFPIAFPTAALNVVATLQTNGDGGNMSKDRLYIQPLTTTGFSIQNPQGTYRYYAVGY